MVEAKLSGNNTYKGDAKDWGDYLHKVVTIIHVRQSNCFEVSMWDSNGEASETTEYLTVSRFLFWAIWGEDHAVLSEDRVESADETHFVINMDNGTTLALMGDT